MINNLRSFLRFQYHAHLFDRLDVIARNKCYMFKLFRFVSKVSLLEKFSVLTGSKDFSPDESAELKAVTHSILKRLREKDLSALVRALETQGGCETPCIFFHSHEGLGKRVAVEPHLVLFRVFRLPQVRSSSELKHIASCSSCYGLDKVCINPYHYSAVMSTEPSGEIYTALTNVVVSEKEESSGFISNLTQSTTRQLDSRTSYTQPCSQTTDYFAAGKEWPKHWCSISYWEHNERIGPWYEGRSDVINVFDWLPEPSGFCLADLNRRSDVSEGTKRVRSQIGYGLQLTREGDEIWIYNRSNFSLFANGPTLTYSNVNIPGGKWRHNIVVHKVPPGCSLKVFDFKLSPQVCQAVDSDGVRCFHPESVRISFKKGWGSTSATKKYCRPLVTSCPCWIEIHLFVSR